jgi:hypothetical protein
MYSITPEQILTVLIVPKKGGVWGFMQAEGAHRAEMIKLEEYVKSKKTRTDTNC